MPKTLDPDKFCAEQMLRIERGRGNVVKNVHIGGVLDLPYLGHILHHAEVQAVTTSFYFTQDMQLCAYLEVGRGGIDGAVHNMTAREVATGALLTGARACGVVGWRPWPAPRGGDLTLSEWMSTSLHLLGVYFVGYVIAADAGWHVVGAEGYRGAWEKGHDLNGHKRLHVVNESKVVKP